MINSRGPLELEEAGVGPMELEEAGVCPVLEQEEAGGMGTVQDEVVEVQQEHCWHRLGV